MQEYWHGLLSCPLPD
jgi:hypothetical protein